MFELKYTPIFVFEYGEIDAEPDQQTTEIFDTIEERNERIEELQDQNNDKLKNERKHVTVLYGNFRCSVI